MSASAGKVMPRPMGDYNALTEYKVLDIVTYNDRPYMAKQTTQGNLPTNTTYWMLLLDFPTEVDNVPTENSNNLVKSGGVYSATASKMAVDGSNATNVIFGTDSTDSVSVDSITKNAGTGESITIVATAVSTNGRTNRNLDALFKSHIGDDNVYYIDTDPVYIVIDSSSFSGNTVTVRAHLKTDDSAAISLTNKSLYFQNYIKSGIKYNEIVGYANGSRADRVRMTGTALATLSENSSAEGIGNSVFGICGHAEGRWTYAGKEAHAEGRSTRASGDYSHAEGIGTMAVGEDAHAEGSETAANNEASHAEGYNTVANGFASHAGGRNTIAGYIDQTVIGKNNANKSNTLFEVGNGSDANTRSNAIEVYSTGHISQDNGTDKYKFAKSGGVDGFYDGSNNFHPFTGYKELVNNSVVLSTSADTTVTFSDTSITADSTIEPFTSVYGINPSNVVASAGQCVVTIPKQSTAQTIKVKIRVS